MTLLEQKSDPLLCSNSNMTLLFPPFYAHLCAHAFPYSLELRHILAAATAFVPDLWCLHQAPLTAIGAVRYSAPAVSPDEAPLTFWTSQRIPCTRALALPRITPFPRRDHQEPSLQSFQPVCGPVTGYAISPHGHTATQPWRVTVIVQRDETRVGWCYFVGPRIRLKQTFITALLSTIIWFQLIYICKTFAWISTCAQNCVPIFCVGSFPHLVGVTGYSPLPVAPFIAAHTPKTHTSQAPFSCHTKNPTQIITFWGMYRAKNIFTFFSLPKDNPEAYHCI